jgi:hypothetical protein
MSRFAPLLERTDRALNLPQPQRARVMQELAADAADLFAHLRQRGLGEREAAGEVEKWLLADSEAIRELEDLHRPLHHRWAARFSQPGQHRVERAALALILVGFFVAATKLLSGTNVLAAPFWSGYALLALGVGAAALATERAIALWLRGGRSHDQRRGLTALACTAPAAVAVSLLGAALALSSAPNFVRASGSAWPAVGTAAAILATGLIVALLSTAAYLGLETRVRWVERMDTIWKEDL